MSNQTNTATVEQQIAGLMKLTAKKVSLPPFPKIGMYGATVGEKEAQEAARLTIGSDFDYMKAQAAARRANRK